MAEPSRLPPTGAGAPLGRQTRRALLSLLPSEQRERSLGLGGWELGQGLLREPCGPLCCVLLAGEGELRVPGPTTPLGLYPGVARRAGGLNRH